LIFSEFSAALIFGYLSIKGKVKAIRWLSVARFERLEFMARNPSPTDVKSVQVGMTSCAGDCHSR
jgi:hypothetical protein